MAYPKRVHVPGYTHHISSRCIEKKDLLKPKAMKDMFLEIVYKAMSKYDFDLITYSIMDNHFHLLIRTTNNDDTISKIMQWIKARFALQYNKMHNRTGPFWNERFRDKVVELASNPDFYGKYVVWYIAYNPVKAGMVRDPRNYPYNGIRALIEENVSLFLPITQPKFFLKLGKNFKERVKKFLEYEDLYRDILYCQQNR